MFEVFKNIWFFPVDCHDLKVTRKNSGRGFLVYFVHWGFFFVVFLCPRKKNYCCCVVLGSKGTEWKETASGKQKQKSVQEAGGGVT